MNERSDKLTPEQRSHRSRIGGYAVHAKHDSNEIAARARKGFYTRFEAEVDPDGVLPEYERKRRATMAFRSYMQQLAKQSAQKRAKGRNTAA